MIKVTDEVVELVELYLEDAPQEYIQACIYGFRSVNMSTKEFADLNREYLPEKKGINTPSWIFILELVGLKKCSKCEKVLDIDNFSKNKTNRDGLQGDCKSCVRDYRQNNKGKFVYYATKRKAAKIQRTPIWLSKEELLVIEEFYIECPEGYQIDHIIPLRGNLVSGLHTIINLQYLTKEQNNEKSNKFDIIEFNNL